MYDRAHPVRVERVRFVRSGGRQGLVAAADVNAGHGLSCITFCLLQIRTAFYVAAHGLRFTLNAGAENPSPTALPKSAYRCSPCATPHTGHASLANDAGVAAGFSLPNCSAPLHRRLFPHSGPGLFCLRSRPLTRRPPLFTIDPLTPRVPSLQGPPSAMPPHADNRRPSPTCGGQTLCPCGRVRSCGWAATLGKGWRRLAAAGQGIRPPCGSVRKNVWPASSSLVQWHGAGSSRRNTCI